MGAEWFVTGGLGRNVQQVFEHLVAEATRTYGDEGYTGSIAEKREYVVMYPGNRRAGTREEMVEFAYTLDNDGRIADKWGACAAIPFIGAPTVDLSQRDEVEAWLDDEHQAGEIIGWVFCGWASS